MSDRLPLMRSYTHKKNDSFLLYMSVPDMDIQRPWIDYVKSGHKTVEGRTGPLGKFDHLIGRVITIVETGNELDSFKARILAVRHYDDLPSYVETEGWQKIAPHTGSNRGTYSAYADIVMGDDNVQVFSPERIQKRGGINAIELQIVKK
jgi:ASC-1-like (ASCH) protein